jgi:hypothetical protein
MPESELGSKASGQGSGGSTRESFASYDPATCSWRTSQLSLDGGSEQFSETFPRAGTMRNGRCSRRRTWVPRTYGRGSFSLPTPSATEYGSNQSPSTGATVRPSLPMMARHNLWPTPQAHDATKGYAERVGRYGTKHGARNLNDEVQKWPTPQARDWKGPSGISLKGTENDLPNAVRSYPTPTSNDHKGAGYQKGKNGARFFTLPGAAREADGMAYDTSSSGQLNPTWVEWLMGFPLGWTDLEPLATPSSHNAPSSSDG